MSGKKIHLLKKEHSSSKNDKVGASFDKYQPSSDGGTCSPLNSKMIIFNNEKQITFDQIKIFHK